MHNSPEATFKQGAKTFSLAAIFFPKEKWTDVTFIYQWCRYCDDYVDELGKSPKFLLQETELAFRQSDSNASPFHSLSLVFNKYGIPPLYAYELIQGLEMDHESVRYETMSELKLYCYRVASTVGLMLCYIMGIFHISALEKAANLGMAMQLTNIARDVKEDFGRGRIYLPLEWVRANGITPESLMTDKGKLFEVVKKLLKEAECLYESGLKGIEFLPLRSAFVICIAGLAYREIGRKILLVGPEALDRRVSVTRGRKFQLIVLALFMIAASLSKRTLRRRKTISISQKWSFA